MTSKRLQQRSMLEKISSYIADPFHTFIQKAADSQWLGGLPGDRLVEA